jgi:hypothetical protein
VWSGINMNGNMSIPNKIIFEKNFLHFWIMTPCGFVDNTGWRRYKGYRVFPGSKERPGRDAYPSPPSSAVGHERGELYFYSPYGSYGLYRASVPVQGWHLLLYLYRLKEHTAILFWAQEVLHSWGSGSHLSKYTASLSKRACNKCFETLSSVIFGTWENWRGRREYGGGK